MLNQMNEPTCRHQGARGFVLFIDNQWVILHDYLMLNSNVMRA